jgi:hypothetical protein
MGCNPLEQHGGDMTDSTRSQPSAKLELIADELAKLNKKRERLRRQFKEVDDSIRKLSNRERVERVRLHIGRTVEFNGGLMNEMHHWMNKRGTLVRVGRTRALVDFGECEGNKYRGKWWVYLDELRVFEDEPQSMPAAEVALTQ